MPVIGFLNSLPPAPMAHLVAAFRQGLRTTGYAEGVNVAIEFRWADGQYDRLPAMAVDLVDRHVAVIVAGGGEPAGLAAQTATLSIPIVFAIGGDPVKVGLVASLNRPGANITGATLLTGSLEAKRLGLLRDAALLQCRYTPLRGALQHHHTFPSIRRWYLRSASSGVSVFLMSISCTVHRVVAFLLSVSILRLNLSWRISRCHCHDFT
jgi:ABC transporter substrate binding protein